MRRRFDIQPTEDLSVFAAVCGTPGLSADTVAAHRADGHLAALDPAGAVAAHCSLWWRSAPPLPGHRPGVIGHYAAGSAAAGAALLKAACRHLAARGCTAAVGPMDGNTWRSYRLIARTGPRPAFFLEPDVPLAWAGHFELSAFKTLARYFSAITGRLEYPPPPAPDDPGRRTGRRISLRPLEPERFEEELCRIYPLCIESFKDILQARQGETPDTVVLKTLAVAPQFRGAGLGQALVAACQSAAAGRGFRHVIHALIREGNPSGRISARIARPIRSYALFAKELVRA